MDVVLKKPLGSVLKAAPLVSWPSEKYLQCITKIKDMDNDVRTSDTYVDK